MEEFKLCSDGEFMPVNLPCPPPYSGPYYYYPYENIPFPPPAGGSYDNNGGGGGAPISAGAVAGIIILAGFIIVMLCVFAIKFRTRLFSGGGIVRLSSIRNARNMETQAGAGDLASTNSGDVLLNFVGGGLEEKLVNLLPVFEYVRFQDEGKELLNVQQKLEEGSSCTECAVCLSLFEEKDIVRILPKCKHVFHLLCIDKWFESHANCPLCREKITLQTIQLFLKNSEDRALDVDGHHQQLAEFDACQNGASHLNNHDAISDHPANLNLQTSIENCDDQQHDLVPHHYQNGSNPQQETDAFAACTPRDNELLPSAAANDAPPQTGYHATKQYQSELAGDQNHGFSEGLTSVLQDSYPSDQSFSFPVTHHAVEGDKEFSCVVVHAEYEAARSAPTSTESFYPGHEFYHEMRPHSQNQRCGEENDNSGIHQ